MLAIISREKMQRVEEKVRLECNQDVHRGINGKRQREKIERWKYKVY